MGKGDVEHTSWTLRLKHGKHTILLFTEPLTPFPKLIADLLEVLHERYPTGLPTSNSPTPEKIPESALEVLLGAPIDVYDTTKGWTVIDTAPGGDDKRTPKGAGLKDGSAVAFAFKNGEHEEQPDFEVEFSNLEELYPEEG